MSNLDRLKIQGIRSFGPEKPRILQFYSPLTLILGQNGCGKTTIIESLKYITTGEVPPGCGRGASFVHDPKIAKESCVRGQIKLRFKTVKGTTVTACRSVEVQQKPKKIEFSSLESTIQYIGPDGKISSVTNKCIDFQLEMASLLGVAKPILENVIFCHQEESNWPLDEGKKLKDKFDAIFNATKYIKCLECIRKLKKDKTQDIKNKKDTLEALRANKETASRTRQQLETTREEETKFEREKDNLNEACNPLKKRIKELSDLENQISTINGDISGKEHQLQNVRDMQSEIRSKQVEKFDCSDADLRISILDFDRNTRQQESKQREIDAQLRRTTVEIDKLKKEESSAHLRMGKLEAARKTHQDNMKLRDELLRDIVIKYDIMGYDGHNTYDSVKAAGILKSLETALLKRKEKIGTKKSEFVDRETSLQKEMYELRSEETTLEHDISNLTKQIAENVKDSRALRKKLNDNEEELSSTSLEDLQSSLNNIIKVIEDEERKINVVQLNEEIELKRNERDKHDKELEELKKKIAKLNRMAQARSQYDIHVKDRKSLEDKNKMLRRKNEEDFENIFNGVVGDNVKNEFEAQFINIRTQINSTRENKSKLDQKSTELKMKIENEKREISKLEMEIRKCESELEKILQGKDLEMAIERLKDKIELLNKSKGDIESSGVMFKGFVEKISKGEGCPLCHRDFDEDYQKDLLVEEMEGKMKRLPNELSKVKRDLQREETVKDKLLELRPQKESSDKAAKELENKKTYLKKLQSNLEEVNLELEQCSTRLDFLMCEEEACNRVQADVVTLDANIKNIRSLNEKISNIQATLGTVHNDLSMDDLLKKQSDLEQKLKNLRNDIEERQNIIVVHNKDLQMLNNQRIELTTKQLQLRTKQQETEKLKEQIDKLKLDKERMEEKIEENQKFVAPLKLKLKEKEKDKNKLALEKESFLDQENKKIEAIRDDNRKALEVHNSIEKYIEDGREEALSEGKRELESLQEKNRLREAEKINLQEEANHILREITTQRERKRNMEDERTVREKEKEAKRLENEIKVLKEKLKNSEYDKIIDEKEKLQREYSRNFEKISTLEGRLSEIIKKATELEETLNTRGIRDAEQKYKEMFIAIKCLEIAGNDLNKYYKALETAIMRFHQDKMNNINSIIRELWRSTYKGNDIDYVEIKTDETESQGADKRRTYNYRVVMLKNEVEMDMRGRCSAGQKVLASLIIRMALAETFSSNCGILALDEPTTNLDRENIEALSLALLNIVNKRSHQKNFQLIIITHDDEFLDRMTRADFIDYYYKISRDEHGLSVITKYEVEKKD